MSQTDTFSFKYCVYLGFVSTVLAWIVIWFLILDHSDGWSNKPSGLFYNIPIFIPFLILAWQMIFSAHANGFKKSIQSNQSFVLIWIIGFILLYLRLGLQIIEISGHMTWVVLMLTHSYIKRLPWEFIAFVVLIALHAGYYNFFVFSSKISGLNGILMGSLLSLILFGLEYFREKRQIPA